MGGEQKILEKYSKLISYTTKFDGLLELYGKCKNGINIQSQIDDGGSTATLSNNSSLSPRISSNGSNGSSPNNGEWHIDSMKEEIHYFEEEDIAKNTRKIQDSPHPFRKRKELKLPNRTKQNEEDDDLLFNANKTRQKKKENEQKSFSLSIVKQNEIVETSSFLQSVSNAMDQQNNNNQKRKAFKRKFDEISTEKSEINNHHISKDSNKLKPTINGHQFEINEFPPNKKIKIMNGMNGHSLNDDIDKNIRNGNYDKNKNNVTTSVLIKNGGFQNEQNKNNDNKVKNKYVRFIGTEDDDIDITMTRNKLELELEDEFILHSHVTSNNLSPSSAKTVTAST